MVEVSAPSNIALIKYMGKQSSGGNLPLNASLSYTLEHLRSFVRLSVLKNLNQDQWKPLSGPGLVPIQLSERGQQRFLAHLAFLKQELGLEGALLAESANNFPSDCGLASSASSFAALTLSAYELSQKLGIGKKQTRMQLAELARRGSGSSCRSFFSPWSVWDGDGARLVELPLGQLLHQVVVVESSQKQVSSSEAHRRVISSALFLGRQTRAEARLGALLDAFRSGNWQAAFEISWAEFWDMHALFETSQPSFGYMTGGSLNVLRSIETKWKIHSDGPLVTMDAGANVHLLYRQDQFEQAKQIERELGLQYSVLNSYRGKSDVRV
jgi:diphosphomevalonate decarboxylase